MNKKRRESDKSAIQRKEAKKTMPIGALREKETKTTKHTLGSYNPFATKKAIVKALQQPAEEADPLLHDGLSQFERQLIQECREDGMSDSEIREWMQEI